MSTEARKRRQVRFLRMTELMPQTKKGPARYRQLRHCRDDCSHQRGHGLRSRDAVAKRGECLAGEGSSARPRRPQRAGGHSSARSMRAGWVLDSSLRIKNRPSIGAIYRARL
jgi:hypothetical protein